ncbi:MAG: beta-ketoacyl synthase chain length factor [Cyclobacteriaceae bacterium]|nr:beta-ketoacyl synthase chain length factor [Cyclobacteriaceae bacterium]
MAVYIKGMGAISPQKTWDDETLLSQAVGYRGNRLTCIEPDYNQWIDARTIRRMSRIIKMGVTAAFMALKEAGVERPDGIITGTGLGCLEDTGIFLMKMTESSEMALNPTPFIQSTHNTIGSQMALLLQCQQYNQTYAHESFSFESALLDASLQLEDYPDQNIVVGGVDEITEISHTVYRRFPVFRREVNNTLTLFESDEPGTIHGEGAAFFVLSGKRGEHDLARIEALTTLYKPDGHQLKTGIKKFLDDAGISPDAIDLVLVGKSGDATHDQETENTTTSFFPSSSIGLFKHLCGEYPTASAFGLWLAARMLQAHHTPDVVVYRDTGRALNNVLLYNPYFGTHHSLILLKSCRDTL